VCAFRHDKYKPIKIGIFYTHITYSFTYV